MAIIPVSTMDEVLAQALVNGCAPKIKRKVKAAKASK
jgi:hypothetical protein